MTRNILTCPDCEAEMTPVEIQDDDDILCGLVLACDCGTEFGVAQVYYPDDTFVLVADRADTPCERCESEGVYRVQPVGSVPRPYCDGCLAGYLVAAHEDRPRP